MSIEENIDLTRGYKKYDSRVKNLEGIFNKVGNILDISKYREELKNIQDEVYNDSSLANPMPSMTMQLDYEDLIYSSYTKRIEELTGKVEEETRPLYELHLLSSKVDMQLSEINIENIGDIIENTKKLIDTLNSLNLLNIKDKRHLLNNAYKIIYSVILHEEIFDRNDVLTYINKLNIPANRENIGRLLAVDLKELSDGDFIDEDLRTINTEGLGYDYLNADIIQKVSRKTVGEKSLEYQERKKEAIFDISSKVQDFCRKKELLSSALNDTESKINSLRIYKTILFTKALALILVPIITFSAGKAIGKNASDKITEYKTVTRTVDLNTGKVIGDVDYIYDEKETTYVATILECMPWRKNPAGIGYIRNVTAYEYIAPENVDNSFHVTSDYLNENVKEKYKYLESKENLEANDSTTDTIFLVTETYQDKNDNRKSTKYIIPFSIVGAVGGIALDVALVLLGIYDFERMMREFDSLNEDIQRNKLDSKNIKKKLLLMKDEAINLQNEYGNVVKKYGNIADQLTVSDAESAIFIKGAKKIGKR